MCNLLIDPMPSAITVDGIDYHINTDYRYWIEFERIIFSKDNDENIIIKVLETIFKGKTLPPLEQIETVWQELLKFYTRDKQTKKINSSSKSATQIYDYDYDDDYIYSAFLQQYHIDLCDIEYLHWWKFRAMFASLTDDCKISQIMSYRAIDINNKMSKEEQAFYRRMKNIYAIPLSKSEQQKLDELENALLTGENIENVL